MKPITSVDDIQQLGTILCVFAHPDDETLSCGGIMAVAAKNGQRVVCITATKGEKGVQDAARWPAERMGEIRAAELQAALKVLGVKEQHWLDYIDGEMQHVADEEGAAKVQKFIADINPDTIFTFAPDGLTGHLDHQAICRWTMMAAKQAGSKAAIYHAVTSQEDYEVSLKQADDKFDFYFAIDKPNLVARANCAICLQLPEEVMAQKIAAVKCMASQYDVVLEALGDDWARSAFRCETFVRADS